MYNLESLLENEMHKLPCDFEIQMDHLNSPDDQTLGRLTTTTTKEPSGLVVLVVPEDHRVKLKEGRKRDKYLDLARE